MKTFKIAALCLSMAAAAFTVQAKEVKYEADVAIVGGGPCRYGSGGLCSRKRSKADTR